MRIKFTGPGNTDFHTELNQRVNEYFSTKGGSRKANGAMIFKMVVIFTALVLSYAALLSNRLTEFQMIVAALLFGFAKVLVAFNIGHDASHGALFASRKLNRLFSYSFNLIGISNYIWNIKHNLSHHSFTNIPGSDMDIEQSGIARVTPSTPWKPIHRFQHLYLPFIYPFFSLFLVFFKDFKLFSTGTYGNITRKHPRNEYVILVLSKLFYLTYSLIIPLIVIDLPWWKILAGYLLVHMVLGSFIVLILFPGHLNEESKFTFPDADGNVKNNWVIHQVECTMNCASDNRFVTWIAGGLNTHVAHHLYPKVCHIHYFNITKIIREVARKHGVIYQEQGLFEALFSHFKFLKAMGRSSDTSMFVTNPA